METKSCPIPDHDATERNLTHRDFLEPIDTVGECMEARSKRQCCCSKWFKANMEDHQEYCKNTDSIQYTLYPIKSNCLLNGAFTISTNLHIYIRYWYTVWSK